MLLVKIYREVIEDGYIIGFIVGETEEYYIISLVSEDIYLNGWTIIRKLHVSHIEYEFESKEFIEKAISIRKEKPHSILVNMNIKSLKCILDSIKNSFDLVSLAREIICPDEVIIGSIQSIDSRKVNILCMDTNANYELTSEEILLADITTICVGSGYLNALMSVNRSVVNISENEGGFNSEAQR
jgi:hypothetical protein